MEAITNFITKWRKNCNNDWASRDYFKQSCGSRTHDMLDELDAIIGKAQEVPITKQEIEVAFRKDLQELFDKYQADFEVADHWQGYPECGQDLRATVTIPSKYNDDNECTREYTEIVIENHYHPMFSVPLKALPEADEFMSTEEGDK